MRKLVALVMVVLMAFGSVTCAEGIDLDGMSEEQLVALIDDARLALAKYHPSVADGTVLYEDENVRVTLVGAPEVDDYDSLLLNVIVENYSDHNLIIHLENTSCNGWSIYDSGVPVPANKKAKKTFDFMNAVIDAELASGEDVQDVEGDLYYFDSDTYDNIIDPVHVTWTFG